MPYWRNFRRERVCVAAYVRKKPEPEIKTVNNHTSDLELLKFEGKVLTYLFLLARAYFFRGKKSFGKNFKHGHPCPVLSERRP